MKKSFFIPFGRRVTDAQRNIDESDILVGRENERSFLINLLNNAGNRAAVLVTGRRGAGKTTFVDHCLHEYEGSVFKRYLRSKAGRPFWGVFLLFVIAALFPFAGLLTTDFLEIIVPSLKFNPLLVVVSVPLILIGSVPALYALKVLQDCIQGIGGKRPALYAGMFFCALLIILSWAPIANAPALSMANIGLILSLIFFSREHSIKTDGLAKRYDKCTQITQVTILATLLLFLVFVGQSIALFAFAAFTDTTEYLEPSIFVFTVLLAGLLTAMSLVSRTLNAWTHEEGWVKNAAYCLTLSMALGLALSSILYLVSKSEFVPGDRLVFSAFMPNTFEKLLLATGCFGILIWGASFATRTLSRWSKRSDSDPAHRAAQAPEASLDGLSQFYAPALLFLKAIFLLMVSYQVLYPINPIVKYQQTTGTINQTYSTCEGLNTFGPFYEREGNITGQMEAQCAQINTTRAAKSLKQTPNPNAVYDGPLSIAVPLQGFGNVFFEPQSVAAGDDYEVFPTLFAAPLEESLWFFSVLFIIALIYFLEYEWIAKPSYAERDARPVNSVRRNNTLSAITGSNEVNSAALTAISDNEQFQKTVAHRLRAFERATFVWYVCHAWLPALVIRVNLGFDTLSHTSVTQSMLLGLRDAYKRKFLSWSSVYFLISGFVGILLILFATQSIANRAFKLPTPTALTQVHMTGGETTCDLLERWDGQAYEMVKDAPPERMAASSVPLTMCSVSKGLANTLLPVLYFPIIEFPYGQQDLTDRLIFNVLDSNRPLPSIERLMLNKKFELPPESITFRGYHAAIIGILVFGLTLLLRSNPLVPYRDAYRKIQSALTALTSTKTTRKRSVFPFGQSIKSAFGQDIESELRQSQWDPRSVELLLLSILEEISLPGRTFPYALGAKDIIPTPEVTFVFDEVDKITGIIGHGGNIDGYSNGSANNLEPDKQRTQALNNLLSDMKRVISSAPARFIFVGNRLLHDEWIADNTRRESLLTSIFDAEVYLPSLLDDHGNIRLIGPLYRWEDRIWEYLARTFEAGQKASARNSKTRNLPFFALPRHQRAGTTFPDDQLWAQSIRGGFRYKFPDRSSVSLEHPMKTANAGSIFPIFEQQALFEGRATPLADQDANWQRHLVSNLVGYLTLRSVGNPKKLGQIINQLIRPASIAVWKNSFYPQYITTGTTMRQEPTLKYGDDELSYEDVIPLEPELAYRLQLIDGHFRHLQERFEGGVVDRDDKNIVALFYVFEFLLKFHSRAFSWSSLERIDELVHVHRSPDIRDTLHSLVEESSERYMHPVLNGMYEFRFRATIAAELRYASRISEIDQEAFNFTLDESQSLKAIYEAILAKSEVTNVDIVFGLGELHEYDQEYEKSRHFYRHCIRLHDETFFYHIGRTVGPTSHQPDHQRFAQLFTKQNVVAKDIEEAYDRSAESAAAVPTLKWIMQKLEDAVDVTLYMPWGVKRLRLMLHIAMTEEQGQNLQSAFSRYANASAFAEALIRAYANRSENADKDDAIEMLKHMSVFYQPAFAQAWVAEKIEDGVDTATSIVEKNVQFFRDSLRFLKDTKICQNEDQIIESLQAQPKTRIADANLALIGSEIHNKSGDLYFFKGGNFRQIDLLLAMLQTKDDSFRRNQFGRSVQYLSFGGIYRSSGTGFEGYALKAHYHYSVGLHELRRFVFYRKVSSMLKFNPLQSLAFDDKKNSYVAADYKRLLSLVDQRSKLFPRDTGHPAEGTEQKPDMRPILPTFGRGHLPNHVSKGIYNNLSDIADSFLSRVSLIQLYRELGEYQIGQPPCKTPEGDRLSASARRNHFGFVFNPDQSGSFGLPTAREEIVQTIDRFVELINDWVNASDEDTVYQGINAQTAKDVAQEEYIKEFFGSWRSAVKVRTPKDSSDLVVFGLATSSLDRLLNGAFLGMAAAAFAERGGYPERAAREYLLVSEALQNVSAQLRFLDVFSRTKPLKELPQASEITARLKAIRDRQKSHKWQTDEPSDLLEHLRTTLSECGIYCLERYSALSQQSWKRQNRDYKVGSVIQEKALSTLCGLVLHSSSSNGNGGAPMRLDIRALNILRDWMGESFDFASKFPENGQNQSTRSQIKNILRYGLERHAYPALNQLKGQKILLDEAALSVLDKICNADDRTLTNPSAPYAFVSEDHVDMLSEISRGLVELERLDQRYDAAQLFPPSEAAFTAGLIDIAIKNIVSRYAGDSRALVSGLPVHRMASICRKYCQSWLEMITMGRKYYISIADRHYLYDDFNDRQMHSNHARLMLGCDLLTMFRHIFGQVDEHHSE